VKIRLRLKAISDDRLREMEEERQRRLQLSGRFQKQIQEEMEVKLTSQAALKQRGTDAFCFVLFCFVLSLFFTIYLFYHTPHTPSSVDRGRAAAAAAEGLHRRVRKIRAIQQTPPLHLHLLTPHSCTQSCCGRHDCCDRQPSRGAA
jgi:hypothetical protein